MVTETTANRLKGKFNTGTVDMYQWMDTLRKNGKLTDSEMCELDEHVALVIKYTKRTQRLQDLSTMLSDVSYSKSGRGGVSFDSIHRSFGIFVTSPTCRRIEEGVCKSLSRFVTNLFNVLCTNEKVHEMARRTHSSQARDEHLMVQVPLLLWRVLDDEDTRGCAIRRRARVMVSQLWKEHAELAIKEEKLIMRLECQHLEGLRMFLIDVVELSRERHANSFANEFRKNTHYIRLGVIAIYNNSQWQHAFHNLDPIDMLLQNEDVALRWCRRHACKASEIANSCIRSRCSEIALDSASIEWSMVNVSPHETGKGVAIQGPVTHAPLPQFVCLDRNVNSKAIGTCPRAIRVVRFCKVLGELINRDMLRLDLISFDYLQRVAASDYSIYEMTTGRIVTTVLEPMGRKGDVPFRYEFFGEIPRDPPLTSEMLDYFEEEYEDFTNSTIDECVTPDECLPGTSYESNVDSCVFPAHCSAYTSQINTVLPDHQFDFVVLVSLSTTIEWSNNRLIDYTLYSKDIMPRVKKICPPSSYPTSDASCIQRIGNVLKRFSDFASAQGLRVSYEPRKESRLMALTIERNSLEEEVTFICRRLIHLILEHLRINTTLPDGWNWKRSERAARRQRANKKNLIDSATVLCRS